MSRHQVWDKDGNLIVDEEIADAEVTDEKEQAIAEINRATTIAELKAAMIKFVNAS